MFEIYMKFIILSIEILLTYYSIYKIEGKVFILFRHVWNTNVLRCTV